MHDHDDQPEGDSDPDSDAAAFRAAIGPVRRHPQTPERPRAPPPRPMVAMHTADEQAALAQSHRVDPVALSEALGDPISYRRDEVSPAVLRRLKRGEFAIEDEVDLHMLDERKAEHLLRCFLIGSRDASRGCVRIIHGKGLGSPEGAVLKHVVGRLLRHRAEVLAFASAPPRHGGTGAVLVLLGKSGSGGPR